MLEFALQVPPIPTSNISFHTSQFCLLRLVLQKNSREFILLLDLTAYCSIKRLLIRTMLVYDENKGETMTGLFITFEGPDGAGKTTQLQILAERLTQEGYNVLCTREPGGTRIGDKIREILLDPANKEMDVRAEALLYAAARAQHVAEVIYPALRAGKIVLCDRFIDSSLAYQGWGRGLPSDILYVINSFAAVDLDPHITLLLDIEPQEGNARVGNRCGGTRDRIEEEHDGFRQRVSRGFRELARLHDARIVYINACRPIEDVHKEIWTQVGQLMKKEGSA